MKINEIKTLIDDLQKERMDVYWKQHEDPDCLEYQFQLLKLDKKIQKFLHLERYAQYEEHEENIEAIDNIDELLEYTNQTFINNQKIRDKVNHQKLRFKKRFDNMQYPHFITITFKDEAFDTDFRRRLREFFKRNNIPFCLVSDYGTQGTKRFHYHGIIDIPLNSEDTYYNQKLLKKKNPKAKHAKVFTMLWLDENIGYNKVESINRRNEAEVLRAQNYVFKYMYKNPDREVFASKNYKKSL